MARTPSVVRQRDPPRGHDRSRIRARASGPARDVGLNSWNGCWAGSLRDGHLSVTPVGGSGSGDHGPRFDQQPIEVSALADACARADLINPDRRWVDGITLATNWFLGDNDRQVVMWDPISGGAFDGLQPDGANLNQGTESTLALLSTLQHARSLATILQ